ncbi:hypothetical protein PT277_05965 [Acetobacteraceae bacterium ESL0709]|nr:hypothetical protein [Acetobacteraceae bacterium ESL0697]MDF7678244.1 hypothetical protein [Acetobacteraceae bacterium ESL0709]
MMARTVLRESSSPAFPTRTRTDNVIPFRQKILLRHKAYLAKWLQAGHSMGLLDALVELPSPLTEQITIWVRENAEPAYIVTPVGRHWVLTDNLNEYELGRFLSLREALNMIRPALPFDK